MIATTGFWFGFTIGAIAASVVITAFLAALIAKELDDKK